MEFGEVTTIPKPWDEQIFDNYLSFAIPNLEQKTEDEEIDDEVQSLDIAPIKKGSASLIPSVFFSTFDDFFLDYAETQLNTRLQLDNKELDELKINKSEVAIDFDSAEFKGTLIFCIQDQLLISLEKQFKFPFDLDSKERRIQGLEIVVKILFSDLKMKFRNLNFDFDFTANQVNDFMSFETQSSQKYSSNKGVLLLRFFLTDIKKKKSAQSSSCNRLVS